MDQEELRALLDELMLTQEATADLFGVTSRSVRNWIAGVSPVPVAVRVVLRLLSAGKTNMATVRVAANRPLR